MGKIYYPTAETTLGTLSDGGRVTGTVTSGDEFDWFLLDLDPDHAYRFTAWTATGAEQGIHIVDRAQPEWSLFTNVANYHTTMDLDHPFTFITPGHQYYLRVDDGTAPGAYTIGMSAMADDYGNSTASARALAVNSKAEAYFDYSGDSEYYSVSATAGITYTFKINADAMSADAWLRAEPIGASASNGWGTQGATALSMSFTATETRNYDVGVYMHGYSATTAPVHYELSVTAQDVTAPVVVSSATTFDGPMRISFDEDIRLGSGTITFGGKTWDVASPAISTDGKTLFIDHGVNLSSPYYYVEFGAGAITDMAGNQKEAGYSTRVVVEGATHGRLVGSQDSYYLGKTFRGTDDTFELVVYRDSPGDYRFTVTDNKVEVANGTSMTDLLIDIERVYFENSPDVMALSLAGELGEVYRLYQAAFDRTPDKAGLSYWIGLRDGGMALQTIANEFIHSKEFTELYGAATTNSAFVKELYENILDRPGEAAGVAYWTATLDRGADRANVLIEFSEGAENQQAAAATIGNGFLYTPYG